MTERRVDPGKFPGLQSFVPKFYRGGLSRLYLPLFYDLIAIRKPRLIVTIGFDQGDAHFAFCQAAQEQGVKCRCVAVRRGDPKTEKDDEAWQAGKAYAGEFYGELAQFISVSPEKAASDFAKEDVDLLLIDDCDSGSTIKSELAAWQSKLSRNAIVLVHGTNLDRDDSPKAAWKEFVARRPNLEFPDGAGLGILALIKSTKGKDFLGELSNLTALYRFAADRMEAQVRSAQIARENSKLETRQIWLDSVMQDRSSAQEVMDHQARALNELNDRFGTLQHDRAKAQQVMDHQAEVIADFENRFPVLQRDREKAQEIMEHQLATISDLEKRFDRLQQDRQEWGKKFEALNHDRANAQLIIDSQTEKMQQQAGMIAQMQQLSLQIKEQKKILKAAKQACRKKGRCFHMQTQPKVRRSLPEKIGREQRRLVRQLRNLVRPQAKVAPKSRTNPVENEELRYARWIAQHEPNAVELERQRLESRPANQRPQISLLMPVYNTPANFLEAMLSSLLQQTYESWELCLVDAGSDRSETRAVLKDFAAREERIHIQTLAHNLGIADNTNHALKMAGGQWIACVDHDDALAPFALYELANAASRFPDADILYSDEDRLSPSEKRHSPFFKPEWSPALLQSFMYLGHLTAYRQDLVEQVGGFRKQFDLSQDYDFALRATEMAREIRHIPHVLYHWREHPESGSSGGKPQARRTNLAALAEAMRRRNLPAEIAEYPTANRARLKIGKWPRVSVIIPTDSSERLRECVRRLPKQTDYPDWEIVVVTNSKLIDSLGDLRIKKARLRAVAFDKPFNFSEKCNLGAAQATGERLVFFNDDVEAMQPDWIQNLIEPLENSEVGAVSPKMLYATGKIQHAGLVTGVRGLIGTAFHQEPGDTTMYANLAQSLRDVSALSAACLAMRREDFFGVGEFDDINTPIAHSDVDLCFKIRAAGLRCVYTPFATMKHVGHVSIGHEEKETIVPVSKEKSSIFLLKRWGEYTTRDPYYPDNMRSWLYADSPEPIRMSARNESGGNNTRGDLLFISHDLSSSGAPMMLLHAANWCQRNGFFVTVMSPKNGRLRQEFEKAGLPLIVDPLVDTGHESLRRFARDFDCLIANTVFSSVLVRALQKEAVPVMWWLHETRAAEHYLREDINLRLALPDVKMVVVPAHATAAVFQPFRNTPVRVLRNAIPDLGNPGQDRQLGSRVRFVVLGTVEPRKGQDIFVQALRSLSASRQSAGEFQIAGRVMDPAFGDMIKAMAASCRNTSVSGSCTHQEALATLAAADVVILPSRDEAMPTVTMLEAMSLGKAIISTTVGGSTEFLFDGENALLVEPENAGQLAAAIEKLIETPNLVTALGRQARLTYEKNFTMDRFGTELGELINEILRDAPSPVNP